MYTGRQLRLLDKTRFRGHQGRYIYTRNGCGGYLFDTILQHGRLHPQLGVLPVQPRHVRWHRRRVRLRLAQALVEAALQSELSHALFLLHNGAHFEQAVGWPDFANPGRITTAHDYAVFGLLEDLEMIGDDGAHLVAIGEEVLALPELVGGFRALVLACEVRALRDISWNEERKCQLTAWFTPQDNMCHAYPCHPRRPRRRLLPAFPSSPAVLA